MEVMRKEVEGKEEVKMMVGNEIWNVRVEVEEGRKEGLGGR